MAKGIPQILQVPPANYIAVRGQGDPNEEGGACQQAISVLYAVAYTLKMSYKTDHKIEDFYEYIIQDLFLIHDFFQNYGSKCNERAC